MGKIRIIKDTNTNEDVYPITHERGVRDSSGVTLETKLAGKQATLVSGTNIKTINNNSILGSGNIEIQGGGGDISTCELKANKVTSITAQSTDVQYPSAKCMYDEVGGITSMIGDIDSVLDYIIGEE